MSYRRWTASAFTLVLILLAAICPLKAQDSAAWADFQQKAAAWRALPVKPALTEDVQRERVQAENAVKEKRLADAAAHYESGLKINPVWPEGHFNAALLYAELEEYEKAIWHMRAYVELVPDAPDAKGAREQTYVWQDKLKMQETVVFRDPATKLMWPRQDSGSQISLPDAMNYCRNLNLAGFSGWRLPTRKELETIYDKKQKVNGSHIKGGIKLSDRCGSVWHSDFPQQMGFGGTGWFECGHVTPTAPALCVRRPGE
jgi:tetratricopeptide (TPR) repeat protein